MYLQF